MANAEPKRLRQSELLVSNGDPVGSVIVGRLGRRLLELAAVGIAVNASRSFKILPSLAHTTNKAGIVGMARRLAVEGREHGNRAKSISPGLIESNATREPAQRPGLRSYMLGKTLLGRLGRPAKGANVAPFLASDESSCVTGVDIVVDGDMKIW